MSVRLVPVPPSVMFAVGTSDGFEDVVLMTSEPGVSASKTVKGIEPVLVSSSIVRGPKLDIVGGVFVAALTVNTQLSVAVRDPSLTVMLIVAVPL